MKRKVAYWVSTGLLATLSVFAAFTYLLGSPQTAQEFLLSRSLPSGSACRPHPRPSNNWQNAGDVVHVGVNVLLGNDTDTKRLPPGTQAEKFYRDSNSVTYLAGTARFEPPKSLSTAKVMPITFPLRLNSGPPEPPEVVAAS